MTDREKLIEILLRVPCGYDGAGAEGIANHLLAHGVTVREPGRWIALPEPRMMWKYRCDQCGCPQDYKHNYCPNCGAKMEEEE